MLAKREKEAKRIHLLHLEEEAASVYYRLCQSKSDFNMMILRTRGAKTVPKAHVMQSLNRYTHALYEKDLQGKIYYAAYKNPSDNRTIIYLGFTRPEQATKEMAKQAYARIQDYLTTANSDRNSKQRALPQRFAGQQAMIGVSFSDILSWIPYFKNAADPANSAYLCLPMRACSLSLPLF
jgi:hypothetical protein